MFRRSKKNLNKKLLVILLMVVVLSMLCVVNASAARLRLKFSHQNNVYDADQLLAETFKKLVEEGTNGEIKITIYPGTLTTSEEEGMEFIRAGTVDIGLNSAGHIAGFYQDIQFLQLPYLFKSQEHYYVARRSKVVEEILKGYEKATGLVALGIYSDCNGFAIASTKPIYTFNDCKGIKLRCMQNPLFVDTYKAFGFTVTPTDWGELYTSLQTGLVDANDLGVYCQYVFKLKEVTKYFAILNQMWTQKVFSMNRKTWNKLTPSQKEVVKMAAQEAVELTDQFQYVREKIAIERAKKDGFVITYPDKAPFIRASEKVYKIWFAKRPHWKKWYEEIQYLDPGKRTPAAGLPFK